MPQLDGMRLTSSYARVLLSQFPGRETLLMAGSGLTAADLMETDWISVSQQLAIFGAAARIAQPGWALAYAHSISAAMHGAMGVAAVSAPTVREGFEVVARFARTRDPYMDFRIFQSEAGPGLEFVTDILPLGELEGPMVEICAAFALAMLRVMCGDRAGECQITFRAAEPDHRALYARYLPVPCRFSASRNAIILTSDLAMARSLVADPALHQDALGACARELAANGAPFPVEARVRWLIESSLAKLGAGTEAPPLSLAQAAQALNLSERTLSRHLAETGTSYRQIREDCCIEQARRLLRTSHLPLAAIAARTGYDDPANFSRAFKRATGMSPGQYRRASDGAGGLG